MNGFIVCGDVLHAKSGRGKEDFRETFAKSIVADSRRDAKDQRVDQQNVCIEFAIALVVMEPDVVERCDEYGRHGKALTGREKVLMTLIVCKQNGPSFKESRS